VYRVVAASLALVTATACGVQPRDRVAWEEPEAALFDFGPYIVIAGETSARVVIAATLGEAPVVEWWRSDTDDINEVGAQDVRDVWVAHLEGLPSTGEIAYRVRTTLGTTPTYVFRIGTEKARPFRFAAFGDVRTGHHVHRSIVDAVARERIDFVVNTGDMVDRGGKEHEWSRFFQIERPLLVDTPIVAAIGNHDMSAREYFRHYFMHQAAGAARRYFTHDWGNMRLVVVDAEIECRQGCEQFGYVEKMLKEGAREGKLMVLALHQPPFSSGYHGSNENVQEPIVDLARRHGVELVLTGHDHNYERTEPIDGTTYVVTGSAGAPIRPIHPRGFTAHARTEPHYMLIDVDSDRLTLRAVNLRGDVFDSTVIEALDPRP
jgi:hypothetical protein